MLQQASRCVAYLLLLPLLPSDHLVTGLSVDPLARCGSHKSSQSSLSTCRKRVDPPCSSSWTALLAQAASKVNGDGGVTTAVDISFETPPLKVYMEDTDAYGVMFNSHYVRAYDRALHLYSAEAANNNDAISAGGGLQQPIVAVQKVKFKASPVLGESYVVKATRVTSKSYSTESICWSMSVQSPDGGTVYNTAEGVVTLVPFTNGNDDMELESSAAPPLLPSNEPTTSQLQQNAHTSTFTLFRDEFDAGQRHLPCWTVLNLWERSRSNALGGPAALRRLHVDDNILFVVVAVDNLDCCSTSQRLLQAGQSVQVSTDWTVQRGGMLVQCHHAVTICEEKSRVVAAKGTVTLMALNAETRRPTKQLPTWLLQFMGIE